MIDSMKKFIIELFLKQWICFFARDSTKHENICDDKGEDLDLYEEIMYARSADAEMQLIELLSIEVALIDQQKQIKYRRS
jgi:hypothetical protein